jgi:hypothetical protein
LNLILGAAIDFTGVTLPFDIGNLLTSGMELVKKIGPFVLLGMAFTFAPQLIDLIKSVVEGEKARKGYNRTLRGHHYLSRRAKLSMDVRDWKERNF